MKFHFNGGLDCPDWVLAQISELSKMELPKFKELCQTIVEHLKVKKFQWTELDLSWDRELNASAGRNISINGLRQIKAQIAVLSFILSKSANYECSPMDLEAEMLQLGLSAAHIEILVDLYKVESGFLKNCSSFKAPSLQLMEICRLENSTEGKFLLLRTKDSSGNSRNLAIRETQMDELKNGIESAINQLEHFT